MENKIIFAGSVGSGKTTAISAVSDIIVAGTEANASDDVALLKKTTTVAMDYGILNLSDGQKVHLYGTPGQDRFDFMWEILSEGAIGFVILIDGSRPDPLADLDQYLNAFRKGIEKCGGAVVIGVTRTEENFRMDLLDMLNDHVSGLKPLVPVLEVDGRRREDVKQMLMALLTFHDISARRSRPA